MSSKESPKLELFFASRAVSTFGDEVWAIALPLFFALAGYSSQEMGFYYSIYAAGTVLGFLILPRLAVRYHVSFIAVVVDVMQMLVFGALAFWFVVNLTLSTTALGVCGFFLACATAIWFGSSETLATQVVDKSEAQSFHRLNYLSSTVGPLLAPLVASGLFFSIGLVGIAIFNAVSFIPQIIAVKTFNPMKLNLGRAPQETQSKFSLIDLLKHPHYGPLLGVTTTVKVGLLGVLPFIPFVFGRMFLNAFVLAGILAAFSLGSVGGALLYRTQKNENLGKVFFRDTTCMFVATAITVVSLKNQSAWIVLLSALIAGFFCARFSVEIRAMRQLISPSEQIPKLVSLQGLFSRVVTPLAGVIYGFIFADGSPATRSYIIATVIVVSGIAFSFFSSRGYENVLPDDGHSNRKAE